MEEKKSSGLTVRYLVLLLAITLVMIITFPAERDFRENYNNLEFSSSMRGVNYEVSLVNKEDPAEFCLAEGQTNDLLIIGIDYFYITQGDQLIYSVAVDNSRFEIHQELSGCWNVVREKDDLKMRIINFSNVDVFFKTRNSGLETHYTDVYQQIDKYISISDLIITIALTIAVIFTFKDIFGE
jgi:hypothetical protein